MTPASRRRDGVLRGTPHVRVLGLVQHVTATGARIALPSASQRAVLAVLALDAGVTIRSEHLCEVLDLSPGALRTTVSRLRGRVGADAIATDAIGYRLTCTTDAEAFASMAGDRREGRDGADRLEEALALWEGAALDEFRHEPWAEAEVYRLEELRSLAVEDLAEARLAAGHGGEAIADLEAHVAANPLRDRPRGLLVRSLASVGRQADALRAYQAYRRHLAVETGTEPSAEVADIERRVAGGWAGRDEPPRADEAGAADEWSELPPPMARPHRAPVGRTRELAALEAARATTASSGDMRSVLLGGEAGIGKTTLATAFAWSAHDHCGTAVLYGRCHEGAPVALQPFRTIVNAVAAAAPTSVLRAHGERVGGDIQRIAPGLANRTWLPPPTTAGDATERHALFESVADLLARAAAHRPLLLVLDDLHWAEPTALQLLRHLVGALATAPVMLVACYRDTDDSRSDALRATLAELDRSDATRLALTAFDDDELAALVATATSSDVGSGAPLVEALRAETGGHPLYAAQLLSHLVEVGDGPAMPPSLIDVVWSRVRALGPDAPAILQAASILGTAFDVDLLEHLTECPADQVGRVLDAAERAALLVEVPGEGRVRFVHALVRRALAADLTGRQRARLHRLAADAIEAQSDHPGLAEIVQLARHRADAGDHAEALRWAALAGDRSLAQLAPMEAARWYEEALDHATRSGRSDAEVVALRVALGGARFRAGHPDARATLQDAATAALACGADGALVDAVLAADGGLMRVGSPDPQQLLDVEAALAVVDRSEVATTARLLGMHALALVHTDRADERHASVAAATALADGSDDQTLVAHLASSLTFAINGPGTLPLRGDLAARAVTASRTSADPGLRFWAARAAYFVAIESADTTGAAAARSTMAAVATRLGQPRLRWLTLVVDAFEAMMAARLDEAEHVAGEALELGTRIGEPDALTIYGTQLFAIRSFGGRYEELLPLAEQLTVDQPDLIAYRLAFGLCSAVVGRREEAQAILESGATAGFADIPNDYLWMTSVTGYAVLALELGDATSAAPLRALLEPYGRQVSFSGSTSQGYLGAYVGKLASVLGDHDAADRHLREALDIAQRCGWRYHQATTLVALAAARRRRLGRLDDDSRSWLDAARALADECSLGWVHAQIDALTP